MKLSETAVADFDIRSYKQGSVLSWKEVLRKRRVNLRNSKCRSTRAAALQGALTYPDPVAIRFLNYPPWTCLEKNSWQLRFMIENDLPYLPMIENGRFIGLLSQKRALLEFLEEGEAQRSKEIQEENVRLKAQVALSNKYTTVISHDLKGLFTQVLVSLELLGLKLENTGYQEIKYILKLARKSAQQVNTSLEAMLLWAKLNSGKLSTHAVLVNLRSKFSEMQSQFMLASSLKEISIQNLLRKDLNLEIDKDMFDCILRNLIYNAIKYTPVKGEIILAAEQGDMETKILIRDNGVGMSSMQKENLFNFMVSTKGTSAESGSGIGLIICREFVKEQHGRIEIESEKNSGTAISIFFPNRQSFGKV